MTAAPRPSRDGELLALARRGDHAAFIELVVQHDQRLRRLADRLLREPQAMDDVLLRSYVTAYESVGQSRAGRDVSAWLFRIAYNACVDALRQRKPLVAAADDPVASTLDPPPDLADATDPEGSVRAALAGLPVAQRVAVVLVDGEGFPELDVAEILGVDPDKIASRLRRARTTVRKALPEPTDSGTADAAVGEAVRLLPIPEHGPQFWAALADLLAPESESESESGSESEQAAPAPAATPSSSAEQPRPDPVDAVGPTARHLAIDARTSVVPLSLRRTSNVVLLLLALAAAVLVIASGLTLVRHRSDSGMAPAGATESSALTAPAASAIPLV